MVDIAKWEEFAASIGMTTAKVSYNDSAWYDFEQFLIDGVTISDSNSRLFTSLYFVFNNSINIISTNKLLRIAKKVFSKNKHWKILGYMIDSSMSDTHKKTQWKRALENISNKIDNSDEILFTHHPIKANKGFMKWRLLSNNIGKEEDKYIKKDIFNSNYLIKERFMGRQTLFSDILFYYKQHSKKLSYRELAKLINHDVSLVFKALSEMKRYI